MRLRSRETERRLRQAALKRIRGSPRLSAEFYKDRKQVGWFRSILGSLVSLALLVLLFPLALAATLFPWLAPPLVLGWIAGQGGAGMDFVLGLASLVGAVVAYLLGLRLVSGLRRSQELVVLAHLPISDREIVRTRQREVLGPDVIFLVPCLAFYATFALAQRLPAVSALAALVLGLVELGAVFGLAALLSGFLPKWLNVLGILVLVVAASTGLAAIVMDVFDLAVPIPWPGLALTAKLLLPTGWANAALQYGLVQGERAAWLMLVPAGLLLLTVPTAMERLRSAYRVREFRLVNDQMAEAVFEDEARWRPRRREVFTEPAAPTADSPAITPELDLENLPLDREAARQQVVSREFLESWNWQAFGWVERTAASVLTPRQRDVLEFLLTHPPEWTQALVILVPLALFVGPALAFFFGPQVPAAVASVVTAALVLAGVSLAPLRVTWTSADRMSSPAFVQVPIAEREIIHAVMVAGSVRGLSLVPLGVIAGVSSFLGAGLNALDGAMVGVRSAIVSVAVHYWSFLVFRSSVTSHGPFLTTLVQRLVYPVLMVTFGASAVVFVLPGVGEPWNTLAAIAMFGSGWLAARYDEWRLNGRSLDLVAQGIPEGTGRRRA